MEDVRKYWEVGEKNKFGNECYKLHFTEFYEDEVLIAFVKDEQSEDEYIFTSELLGIEEDILSADNIEEAKQVCEDLIVEFWEDEISRLEECVEKFKISC